MTPSSIRFFFDYVDPGSFLVERILLGPEERGEVRVERIPFEVTPPPAPLADSTSDEWQRFWEGARDMAAREGVALANPSLVPWTRKAHEMALHARELGVFPAVHRALFEAFLIAGRDLGRVDVLLDLAVKRGLDLTATKAVLDVDRHAPAIAHARVEAEREGVRGVPTLLAARGRLEGFRGADATLDFLRGVAAP